MLHCFERRHCLTKNWMKQNLRCENWNLKQRINVEFDEKNFVEIMSSWSNNQFSKTSLSNLLWWNSWIATKMNLREIFNISSMKKTNHRNSHKISKFDVNEKNTNRDQLNCRIIVIHQILNFWWNAKYRRNLKLCTIFN